MDGTADALLANMAHEQGHFNLDGSLIDGKWIEHPKNQLIWYEENETVAGYTIEIVHSGQSHLSEQFFISPLQHYEGLQNPMWNDFHWNKYYYSIPRRFH